MLQNHFLKVVMHIRNQFYDFLSGLVDSLSFPVTNFQFVTNISEDMIRNEGKNKKYMASESLLKVLMHIRSNAILWFWVVLVDSLSFLLLIFNLWPTFQKIWSKWEKHFMLQNHFFKGCNAYPQCNSMIFEWFSWFLSFLFTNFQFVTNISGDMIENEEKQIKHLYASESLFKGYNAYPQCNSMIFSGLVDSLSFLLLFSICD